MRGRIFGMADILSLKNFIEQTLQEIDSGIAESRRSRNGGIIIAPAVQKTEISDEGGIKQEIVSISPALEKVEFDLSVTVETAKGNDDSAKVGGRFKIGIISAEAGVGGSSNQKLADTTVQRIKFSIPFMITENGKPAKIEVKKTVKGPADSVDDLDGCA
jgi:hypothetical protein